LLRQGAEISGDDEETPFVSDLKRRTTITTVFLDTRKEIRNTRAEKHFCDLGAWRVAAGTIEAVMWINSRIRGRTSAADDCQSQRRVEIYKNKPH